MTSTGQNFVANKDTILKEGWFKKRNFKGEIGRGYSKRWCVLTSRYFEWYDFPVRSNHLQLLSFLFLLLPALVARICTFCSTWKI